MRKLQLHAVNWLMAGLLVLAAGCETVQTAGSSKTTNEPNAQIYPPQSLRPGQKVTIVYRDIPTPPEPIEQTIREDGMITLHLGLEIQAAGKTPGQLSDEIQKLYVPKYYKRLTVVVRSEERFYYVGGQVRTPGRMMYMGEMSVLKAIQSAGDFTDFANRKKVELIRSNGEKKTVDANDAKKHPERDLPVYPGDQVIVPRRLW